MITCCQSVPPDFKSTNFLNRCVSCLEKTNSLSNMMINLVLKRKNKNKSKMFGISVVCLLALLIFFVVCLVTDAPSGPSKKTAKLEKQIPPIHVHLLFLLVLCFPSHMFMAPCSAIED